MRERARCISAAHLTRETALRYAKLMPLEFLISALVTMVVVVDPLGKLIASRGGVLEASGFIAFLETAESAYRLRSGAARYSSWPVWAIGSFLVAAVCLIVIRARIRRENERKSRDNVISNA